MGCWHKTCGLSNLHITAGTPVYVFVLEEDRDSSNCYTTNLFSPLLLPFESVYNDYGGGDDSSGVALPFILSALKSSLVEMELGENQYHDIEVTREKFDIDLFFDAVHENRLMIKHHPALDPTKVTFTMFRKDIVDAILEQRAIVEYVGNGRGNYAKYNNELDYSRYHYKDIVKDIRPLIDQMRTKIAEADPSEAIYMPYSMLSKVSGYQSENLAARWLHQDNYRYSRLVDIRMAVTTALKADTESAYSLLELLLTEHVKGLFIEAFMTAARKTWIPGGHEGSQSESGAALRLLARVTIDVLDQERARYIAEHGEEFNECDD